MALVVGGVVSMLVVESLWGLADVEGLEGEVCADKEVWPGFFLGDFAVAPLAGDFPGFDANSDKLINR